MACSVLPWQEFVNRAVCQVKGWNMRMVALFTLFFPAGCAPGMLLRGPGLEAYVYDASTGLPLQGAYVESCQEVKGASDKDGYLNISPDKTFEFFMLGGEGRVPQCGLTVHKEGYQPHVVVEPGAYFPEESRQALSIELRPIENAVPH